MAKINQKKTLAIFKKLNVILKGHFELNSGRHAEQYVNKDALYPHPKETAQLCNELARRFAAYDIHQHLNKIVVIGPAMGAIILAHSVSQYLRKKGFDVHGIYAEKDQNGNFIIKRGYDQFLDDAKIFIAEDITTTGGSAKKVVDLIKKLGYGANIVAVGALCNRGGVKAKNIGVANFFALANIDLKSWEPNECPLCAQRIPMNYNIGKAKK